jgi:uncharacterized membrane protein
MNQRFNTPKLTDTPSYHMLGRSTLWRCLQFAALASVLSTGALILAPFPHYLPPDFSVGFLHNKSRFFYSSGYFLGFYAHIASSPIALLCGALQMSQHLRSAWPSVHRMSGKVYVALVLCFVAPGGAIMSTRAHGGWSSVICFALISVLAWGFTLFAWRAAKQMRFAEHGRWMSRSYLMMCSAIMLRMVHYLIQPLDLEPTFAYQISAWLSWVPALLVFEITSRRAGKVAGYERGRAV